MSDKTRIIQNSLIVGVVGFGALYLIAKYRKSILDQLIRIVNNGRNNMKKQIFVLNTAQECNNFVLKIKESCSAYNVVGFDAEWTMEKDKTRRPIALVQLATHDGLVGLFRLCKVGHTMPKELRDILEDNTIIKAGIEAQRDANFLFQDYAVEMSGTLDLRYLALKVGEKPGSLAKMSKQLLNIELDKNWRISCSNWNDFQLNEKQIEYAANDAFCGIEIFKKLFDQIKRNPSMKEVLDHCDEFVNRQFKNKAIKNQNFEAGSITTRKIKPVTAVFKRGYAVRRKPFYDNCILQSPDGQSLCTIEKKKAQWYILKGLGNEVGQDPYIVRLNFEPAGRAVGDVGKYYLTPKENHCVVCGNTDQLIRKNVVPKEYRRHFPVVMKDHTSHDVLLLCWNHHQWSNQADLKIRQHLETLCNAPLKKNLTREQKDQIGHRREIHKIVHALLIFRDKIPEQRIEELKIKLKSFYPDNEINEEFLKSIEDNPPQNQEEEEVQLTMHGETVVKYFMEHGGLVELEQMWRQHFLDIMAPKHMPELWSVNHNADRLKIRATEGRVEDSDLKIAGLNNVIRREINGKSANTSSQVNQSKNGSLLEPEEADISSTSVTEFKSFSEDIKNSTKNGSDDTLKDEQTMPSLYETIKSDSSTLNYSDFKSFENSTTEKIKYDSDDSNSTLSQPSSTLDESDEDSEIREIERRCEEAQKQSDESFAKE